MASFPRRVFKLVISCFYLNHFVPYDRSYSMVLYYDPIERIDMSEKVLNRPHILANTSFFFVGRVVTFPNSEKSTRLLSHDKNI